MKQLRIVLANLGKRTLNENHAMPPIGIMLIAAYVREHLDVDIHLVNQRENNLPEEDLVRQIAAFAPEVVGLAGMTNNAHEMQRTAGLVRQALPQALIVVGGPHVSAIGAASALDDIDADAAVAGEGEAAIKLILEAWINRQNCQADFAAIPGIAWRAPDGAVTANPGDTPIIEDLDTLPFPAYDLIDLKKYWALPSQGISWRNRYGVVSSSRGCPYTCAWCHKIHTRHFRAHSAARVVAEIDHLQHTYGITVVEFVDDVFNLNRARVFEFCKLMCARGRKIEVDFPNGLRADLMTEEMIDALVAAGTKFTAFALESGSPRIQELCGKRLDIDRFLRTVGLCVARGLYTRGFTIIGHPTETEEDVKQTVAVACQSKLHSCSFFHAAPYPGTELYKVAIEKYSEATMREVFRDMNYHIIRLNLSAIPDNRFFGLSAQAYKSFYTPWRLLRSSLAFPHPMQIPARGLEVLALRAKNPKNPLLRKFYQVWAGEFGN